MACRECEQECEGCGCRLVRTTELEMGFCIRCLPEIVASIALEDELREGGVFIWDLEG